MHCWIIELRCSSQSWALHSSAHLGSGFLGLKTRCKRAEGARGCLPPSSTASAVCMWNFYKQRTSALSQVHHGEVRGHSTNAGIMTRIMFFDA
jgi:hypothetical protein